MYRGRLWTMRQIAGFGTGEDTNGRFRYLIEQGQTGLSVDFDMPTLMGYDSTTRAPWARWDAKGWPWTPSTTWRLSSTGWTSRRSPSP
jgi:methylmalonyl-CoA mutase N-terminal domain/subunit